MLVFTDVSQLVAFKRSVSCVKADAVMAVTEYPVPDFTAVFSYQIIQVI